MDGLISEQTGAADPARSPRQALAIYVLKVALLAVAYAAAAVFGLSWSVVPGAGTPIWPASGIALAGLVLGGVRLWPGIVIGRLLAAIVLASPQPWWADILIAVCACAGAVVPAWYARRWRLERSLSTLSQMLWLVGAAAISALVSAGPAMLVLGVSGTPSVHLTATFVNWALGNVCGVLVVAPPLLAWSQREAWRLSALEALHLAATWAGVLAMSYVVFLNPLIPRMPTWYVFPLLVWSALAFSVRGVGVSLVIVAALAGWSAAAGIGPFVTAAPTAAGRLLLSQQFVAITAITMLVLAAVADERRGRQQIDRSEARLREETQALETLNSTGSAIAAELDLDTVVQTVTDAGVKLTGAKFGAFFYNVVGSQGEAYMLYALAGAPRSAFDKFGMPRNTAVFEATFSGSGVVRSDDITRDPRYGHNAPHHGMPKGHLPVRSYLAVPVKSRSGEVIGGLFFGHSQTGVFTERAEWIVSGIAAQAAIALDNAQLYKAAQAEIGERRRAEARQQLLINELNHRVKNTLATVQSIAAQTLRPVDDVGAAKEALTSRIIALSRAHDVLTARTWRGADLTEVVARAVQPFDDDSGGRVRLDGPAVWLSPRAALAIALALHELGTNAMKYGALSTPQGAVSVTWTQEDAAGGAQRLRLMWAESGGPRVTAPASRGFGSRLIERGLKADLGGQAYLRFEETGLVCEITANLAPVGAAETFLEVG